MVHFRVVVIFACFQVLLALASGAQVIIQGSLHNRLLYPLVLKGAQSDVNTKWVLKPLPEVANGVRANEDFVVASTEAGSTSGSVTYGISQFDRLNVTLSWQVPADALKAEQVDGTFQCLVAPSPWIGGVSGVKTLNNGTLVVQYWVAQMCLLGSDGGGGDC